MAADGWESLKGQPPNWEAPEQLRGPTASTAINLAVQMMGSNMIGNDVIEVVAEFVSTKAGIELWMGHREPPLTLGQKFAVGRASSEGLRIAYESWVNYERAYGLAGGKISQVNQEKRALIGAVREATAILARAKADCEA
ncbi:hypothetical protein [Streptomyces lushanensis]|uniref:hypothetical protein n=1 Tax=Streptomyces lushanensis TaxID=1434255 RepID=UPI00114C9817|nr:hypothetical protein [Streptomyces lushanensis]